VHIALSRAKRKSPSGTAVAAARMLSGEDPVTLFTGGL